MNILADRHHAGLLYSLQKLFEDRLKMNLYVPVGLDWWDAGYWRFGQVFGDDRLAQQYLVPNPPWHHGKNGSYLTYDVEFPNRPIWGISLTAARDMEWDFTLASVQENQHGYARFAREHGAKAIYQVGNRGQQIDWTLDPLVIASAELIFTDNAKAVRYHQEYDKDTTFAPVDPRRSDLYQIRSFVNCFNSMPQEWGDFRRMEKLLPEFKFFVHGHDGRDGLIQPTEAVAATMAASGWGYHDKPQGDGFGHVIHYWASVGRPLIGNAKYYNGLFAGHLWEDGVTCIDLRLGVHAAAEAIRSVSENPERHAMMCRAIRARLDNLIDFDQEEREIRSLLGLA